ncbi:MAG: 4Fe-4S dicluster domain-containing protein, partial [Chloroflexota bacterium]
FHCDDPPCVAACPTGATFQSPEGVVLTNDDRCAGCKACITACPYGMRYLHTEGYVDKCTYCYHRLKEGRQPACVETCPTSARIFGDLEDPQGPIQRAMAESRSVDRVEPIGGATPSLLYLNSRVLGSRRSLGEEHV